MPDAARDEIDRFIGSALIQAEAVADDVRREIVRVITANRHQPLFEQERLVREIMGSWEPVLAQAVADTDVAAMIVAMQGVVDKVPGDVLDDIGKYSGPPGFRTYDTGDSEPIIRFPRTEEAASDLIERNIVTRDVFDSLSESARRRAFTYARENSVAVIDQVRTALVDELRSETSLRSFRARLSERVETSRIGPAHVENIYRTNIQAAFANGQEAILEMPVLRDVFPYRRFRAIRDSRVRDTHFELMYLGIDGTSVYRSDDKAVLRHITPPLDYQCRCTMSPITIAEAARLGVQEAQEWLDTGVKPPLNSRLPFVDFRRPNGFVGPGVAA